MCASQSDVSIRCRNTHNTTDAQCQLRDVRYVQKSTIAQLSAMPTSLFMYLTAMSAVSIHNLITNINELTSNYDQINITTQDTNWTYSKDLNLYNERCSGRLQSPVRINTTEAKENLNLRLGLTAYDKPISGQLVNAFPSFRLNPYSLEWPRPNVIVSNTSARMIDATFTSYSLHHVQFYWTPSGSNNSSSPHQIDNSEYVGELHFVHLNSAYSRYDEGMKKSDGLLVLVVHIVSSTQESYTFDKILANIKNLTESKQRLMMQEESTWRNLLPRDTSRFYRYRGSLMTPPCYESVTWILFDDKLKLGHKQIKNLRRYHVIGRAKINGTSNYKQVDWTSHRRGPQPLNDRLVERSFAMRVPKV